MNLKAIPLVLGETRFGKLSDKKKQEVLKHSFSYFDNDLDGDRLE